MSLKGPILQGEGHNPLQLSNTTHFKCFLLDPCDRYKLFYGATDRSNQAVTVTGGPFWTYPGHS